MPYRKPRFGARQKPRPGAIINSSHSLAHGLTGAWILNDGAGNKPRDSRQNNDASITGTATQSSQSLFGSGLNFNAQNPAITTYKLPDGAPLTVSLWFKTTSPATTQIIWGQVVGHNIGAVFNSTNVYYENANFSVTSTVGCAFTMDSLWHHLVVADTFSDSTSVLNSTKFYIDGVLKTNVSGLGAGPSAGNFVFGGRQANTSGLIGTIDHVYTWNRALTATEVLQLYTDPFAMFARAPRRVISYLDTRAWSGVSQRVPGYGRGPLGHPRSKFPGKSVELPTTALYGGQPAGAANFDPSTGFPWWDPAYNVNTPPEVVSY